MNNSTSLRFMPRLTHTRSLHALLSVPLVVSSVARAGTPAQSTNTPDESVSPLQQVLDTAEQQSTATLILSGTKALEIEDANTAVGILLEATARADAPAVAHYNLGSAYALIGVLGSARDAFLKAAAMPHTPGDDPVVDALGPDGSKLEPHQLTGSAIYNAALIDLQAADALALSVMDLDPEPAVLSLDPAAAFEPYAQAVNAAVDAYLDASQSFREAHELDTTDGAPAQPDALQNFQLARLRALELRRLLQRKQDAFNEMLEQIIPPQEALERIAELYEQQRSLENQSRAEAESPTGDTQQMQTDQRSVLRQLQDLADRVDNTAGLAERQMQRLQEQGASTEASEESMQQQMLAQVVSEFLRTAQEGIDEAGQNAYAGLRQLEADNPDLAAEEQREAAEALLEIMRNLGNQSQQAQEAAEQMAQQMGDQAQQQQEQQEQAEDNQQQQETEAAQSQEQQSGEQQEGQEGEQQPAEFSEDEIEALLGEILEKEIEDRERLRRGKRQPVPKDW